MQTKSIQEIGRLLGYDEATTRMIIARLIQDGRLRVVTSGDQGVTIPGHAVMTELLSRGDSVSLQAAALIQLLGEQCARYEADLAEWHQVKERRISDTVDPATNVRLILTRQP